MSKKSEDTITEEIEGKATFHLHKWMKVALLMMIYDIIAVNAAYGLALWLRFDLHFSLIPQSYLFSWLYFSPFFTIITLCIFQFFKLYHSVWRFVSFNELGRVGIASLVALAAQIAGTCVFFEQMPISYYVVGSFLQFLAVGGMRFSYRALRLWKGYMTEMKKANLSRVMIVGAGEAGRMLIREISVTKPRKAKACCVIDDNPNKKGRMLNQIPIVGNRQDIPGMVKAYKIDQIIVAMPSAKAQQRKEILDICKKTGCELKILPGISQILNGKAKLSQLRDVSVEELLGREPVLIDMQEVGGYLEGKTVLITGGGGSIGSELARQVAQYSPKQLILLDIYENNAYDIQQELKWHNPELNLKVLIGSVRDRRRVRHVMATYRPDIVYHAAAHKHVPLMEASPNEAIKNNVLGTYETARAASDYGVSRFVLISTDKAVNPTNIMGASKRLCEMIVQAMDRQSHTSFTAVRFGNVLGSNGSVIPLFKKQIAAGGPVTVTHPEITRFFMTIPEAVSLVLQAGAYAGNGEIFVLDMGKPVKIDELARNLILLSGHIPDGDIRVEYTGLRPGEKLYEELLMAEEGLKRTKNELIFVGQPLHLPRRFLEKVEELEAIVYENPDNVKILIHNLVPTYQMEETSDGKTGTSSQRKERQLKTQNTFRDLDREDNEEFQPAEAIL